MGMRSVVDLLLSAVALILHSTGFATNYWKSNDNNDGVGLWKATNCSGNPGGPCYVTDVPSTYKGDFFIVVQVTESIVLFLLFFVMVLLILDVCMDISEKMITKVIDNVTILTFFVALMGTFFGGFFVHLPDFTVDWSFWLTVATVVLSFLRLCLHVRPSDDDKVYPERSSRNEIGVRHSRMTWDYIYHHRRGNRVY